DLLLSHKFKNSLTWKSGDAIKGLPRCQLMKNSHDETVGKKHAHRSHFTQALGAFGSATLISRILGYARDAAVAAYFGGGYQTDAFYAAFKIPNLLRRFLGEGSLTSAFV